MNGKRQRFIETQAGREQTVVSIDVGRAPVVSERSVQALCGVRVNTPESLAGHAVQEIIPRLSFSRSRPKVPGIVGGAELIKPGVSFPGFNIVESSHRRRFFAWSESNLRNNYCSSMKLWNQASWIMRERVAVLGDDHRFDIEVLEGDNADFRSRRRGRIKRFEVRK